MPAAILSIIFSGSFTKEESQRTAAQDAMECSAHHFAQVFNDYRQPFIHFAYTYTRNATVAEDIVMDAVLSFWELRESLPQETDIPAYLFGTIRNKSIDHLRKELRKRKAAGILSEQAEWEMKQRITFLDESGQSLFTKEIRTIAEDTLESLSERSREVFTMSRVEGISQKEIAWKLGMSVKGVQFHITKILNELRIALKDYLK